GMTDDMFSECLDGPTSIGKGGARPAARSRSSLFLTPPVVIQYSAAEHAVACSVAHHLLPEFHAVLAAW
ncbi:MAG: hypothetical protein ACK4JA_15280, partial [Parazoarcus communis]